MKTTFLGIMFASVECWWISAVVVSVVSFIAFRTYRKKETIVGKLVNPRWRLLLLKYYSSLRVKIRLILWVAAFVCVGIALLSPQWDKKEQHVEQEGRELFVALDVSRSMLAEDVQPSRLVFAQSKIKRLLQLLPAERVGLIVFAGVSVVQCPLTRDVGLFSMFLNQIDSDTISPGTTALDQVIMKVIQSIEKMPTRKNKILVIFTDGEDFSSQLAQVKQKAQEIGLHIFTYGVGTQEGAPIPIMADGKRTGFEKNEQGNVILSRLNEGILRSLSQETGAYYIAPTQSDDDLKTLVSKVSEYEKESFEDRQLSLYEDRYPFFLAGALIALIGEWLL